MHPIAQLAQQRGITRLCHFTPSRNLVHIASDKTGILATSKLQEGERGVFTATDLSRYDNRPGHICCSIQYPNGWFFSKARAADRLFQDWVVLLLKPDHLWSSGTEFCPWNAAAAFGSTIRTGVSGFNAMYEPVVSPPTGRQFRRTPQRLASCPTDDQAEVLISDAIPLSDVLGVVVQDEVQARNEHLRFQLAQIPTTLDFIIAPSFFAKYELSGLISRGLCPAETKWSPTE